MAFPNIDAALNDLKKIFDKLIGTTYQEHVHEDEEDEEDVDEEVHWAQNAVGIFHRLRKEKRYQQNVFVHQVSYIDESLIVKLEGLTAKSKSPRMMRSWVKMQFLMLEKSSICRKGEIKLKGLNDAKTRKK